jgi:hypothetical protein
MLAYYIFDHTITTPLPRFGHCPNERALPPGFVIDKEAMPIETGVRNNSSNWRLF